MIHHFGPLVIEDYDYADLNQLNSGVAIGSSEYAEAALLGC
jgi:hypothetical protein